MIDRSLPENFQNLSQTLWAHDVWERCCQCFFCLFFKRKGRAYTQSIRSGKPGFPHDLLDRRAWLPCANSRAAVQQRHSESTCSSAGEDGAPQSDPRSLGPTLQDQWHFLGTSSGQSCEELRRLNIPSASHLGGENHQSSAATLSRKLRVNGFLLAPCCLQGGAIVVGGPRLGRPVPPQGGHHCAVSTANCAPRHSVSPSATISSLRPSSALNVARSTSRTNTFVATRAPASLQTCAAAHSRGNPLFPQHPCL